jgi:hypothetical protein
MGVRPLNGLVSIAEYPDRFDADAAVALLASAGIEAVVLGDPAQGVAPHLVTHRGFSILVRIAIADDAQQVLVRRPGAAVDAPSPLVHPTLRSRSGPPPPEPPPALEDPFGDEFDEPEPGETGRLTRPAWVKPVAWLTAGAVVLPLVLGAVRTLGQL